LGRRATKTYRSGDQIHIAVTQNFEETATEFFQFCKDNHYNPSEVIRSCMEQWLQKQQRIKEMMEGNLERDAKEAMEREKRILERLKEEGLSG
jgi:cyclophilin family peptidyl-prolyl cis-trans isomerase